MSFSLSSSVRMGICAQPTPHDDERKPRTRGGCVCAVGRRRVSGGQAICLGFIYGWPEIAP
eukprot:1632326-Prymnesium_polylepis.1